MQGTLPMHGFVRTRPWTLVEANPGRVVFTLSDCEETRNLWPHAFELKYTVTFDATSLTSALAISNPSSSSAPFAFEAVLHGYFSLGLGNVTEEGSAAQIKGLKGLTCIAKPSTGYEVPRLEESEVMQLKGEFDRIFTPLSAPIIVTGVTTTTPSTAAPHFSTITLTAHAAVRTPGPKLGSRAAPLDLIIWNPGSVRAKMIADLGDDDWTHFVSDHGVDSYYPCDSSYHLLSPPPQPATSPALQGVH